MPYSDFKSSYRSLRELFVIIIPLNIKIITTTLHKYVYKVRFSILLLRGVGKPTCFSEFIKRDGTAFRLSCAFNFSPNCSYNGFSEKSSGPKCFEQTRDILTLNLSLLRHKNIYCLHKVFFFWESMKRYFFIIILPFIVCTTSKNSTTHCLQIYKYKQIKYKQFISQNLLLSKRNTKNYFFSGHKVPPY